VISSIQVEATDHYRPRSPIQERLIMSNEQKVAIVTGASQGIGAGVVKAYRDNGFVVVANSRGIKPSADEGVIPVWW
jgi:3-oxoacyl-ACP reductase-like protein